MDTARVERVRELRHARQRPPEEVGPPEKAYACAHEQGGGVRLRVSAVVPWMQVLQILKVLKDAEAGEAEGPSGSRS